VVVRAVVARAMGLPPVAPVGGPCSSPDGGEVAVGHDLQGLRSSYTQGRCNAVRPIGANWQDAAGWFPCSVTPLPR
jgi:hypothetical protein